MLGAKIEKIGSQPARSRNLNRMAENDGQYRKPEIVEITHMFV
jgi:hypothetical protein